MHIDDRLANDLTGGARRHLGGQSQGLHCLLAHGRGGGEIHASLLEEHLAQKAYVYLAPKIFGGKNAGTPVCGAGVPLPADAFLLKPTGMQYFNEDLLLEFDVLEGGTACLQD